MSLLSKLFSSKQAKTEPEAETAVPFNKTVEALRQENERRDREFNAQMAELNAANEQYKSDGDIDKVIAVYERYFLDPDKLEWNAFNQCLHLADLYAKAGRNDTAWGYLNKMYLHAVKNPKCNWETHKIRFAQFKVLKSEKRHADAFRMLVSSYVIRSDGLKQPYFNKNTFIKDAKSTAKGLGLSDNELTDFANLLEQKLMKRALHDDTAFQFCSDYLSRLGK